MQQYIFHISDYFSVFRHSLIQFLLKCITVQKKSKSWCSVLSAVIMLMSLLECWSESASSTPRCSTYMGFQRDWRHQSTQSSFWLLTVGGGLNPRVQSTSATGRHFRSKMMWLKIQTTYLSTLFHTILCYFLAYNKHSATSKEKKTDILSTTSIWWDNTREKENKSQMCVSRTSTKHSKVLSSFLPVIMTN